MSRNAVAENVLGTIGTVLWTGQILPQNWKSWREHSTEGLSPYLVFLWALAALFLGVYNITQNINIPLIIQPQLFGFLCAFSCVQCFYYSQRRPLWFCALALALYSAIGAGFETGMIFLMKHKALEGDSHGIQAFGTISSVLIGLGLLPQYWEIWRRREVVGVSYVFMTIDISGAVFSIMSLAFKTRFDFVAAATYIVVVIMDGAILVAAAILNPRARRRREGTQSEDTLQDSTPPTSDKKHVDSEKAASSAETASESV